MELRSFLLSLVIPTHTIKDHFTAIGAEYPYYPIGYSGRASPYGFLFDTKDRRVDQNFEYSMHLAIDLTLASLLFGHRQPLPSNLI